jgi:hypothetical protein
VNPHHPHQIPTPKSEVVTTPGVYRPGVTGKQEETTVTDHHLEALEQRYRHGYAHRRCEGEIVLALFGGQPRHYTDATLLTRTAGHPDPDNAAPAVVLARSATGIAVLELFDLPDTADRTVVDLAAERDRRRVQAGDSA